MAVPAESKLGKKNPNFDGTPARRGTLVTKGSGVSMRFKKRDRNVFRVASDGLTAHLEECSANALFQPVPSHPDLPP